MALDPEDVSGTASEKIALHADVHGGRVRVSVAGEIDVATVPALRAFASAAVTPDVTELVIDLSQATLLDSIGVQFLLLASRGSAALGVAFSLLCPANNRPVVMVLDTLHLGSVMTIVRSTTADDAALTRISERD